VTNAVALAVVLGCVILTELQVDADAVVAAALIALALLAALVATLVWMGWGTGVPRE
jgi:hypothetical protein